MNAEFTTEGMKVKCTFRARVDYTDWRAFYGTCDGPFNEEMMRIGKLGPPHPSWCQKLWSIE